MIEDMTLYVKSSIYSIVTLIALLLLNSSLISANSLQSYAKSEVLQLWEYHNNRVPVISVFIHYDSTKAPKYQLSTPSLSYNYIKQIDSRAGFWNLSLTDANGIELTSQNFVFKTSVTGPIPKEGSVGDCDTELEKAGMLVQLPWHDQGNKLHLTTPEGDVFVFPIDTPPLQTQSTEFTFLTHQLSSSPADTVNTVFIGDDYLESEMSKFHQDVDRFSSYLLTFEPFKTRKNQMAFAAIDNTEDLGCIRSTYVTCDYEKVFSIVNQSEIPYDRIVVIWNNIYSGGSSSNIAVVTNSTYGHRTFVHEFGHLFVGLTDEYVKSCTGLNSSNNCYLGTPPRPEWEGLVSIDDYYLGCYCTNLYRSSETSIMRSTNAEYFNAVGKYFANKQIDDYAGPWTPEPTPGLRKGDLDNDGDIDWVDFLLYLNHFGKKECRISGDLNSDCIIDILDYNIMFQYHKLL
jgi:hypothetical protein